MNKKLFLICVFFTIASVESVCNSNSIYSAERHHSSRIKLEEILNRKLARSNFIPYIVEIDDQSIDVTYLKDLSNTTIEIFSESGECTYRTTVNPTINGHLFIHIEDWTEGCYTIYLKNSSNNHTYYGEFELQPMQY